MEAEEQALPTELPPVRTPLGEAASSCLPIENPLDRPVIVSAVAVTDSSRNGAAGGRFR